MMSPTAPQGSPLREDIRWSKRQREVLDLLADRKTNGEIAQALGITLDGAKYHVREILEKLDVDTREEAAEWWRQKHGMRARMRVIQRRMRMPALAKVAGVGAAGVAAVAGLAIIFSSTGEDDTFAMEPGLWAALAVPVEPLDTGALGTWELRLQKVDGVEHRVLGERGVWGRPAFSPDGRLLAVVGGRPLDNPEDAVLALHIFEVDSGNTTVTDLPDGLGSIDVHWSPDGSGIALIPHSILTWAPSNTVLLYSRAGEFVANVDLADYAAETPPHSEGLLGPPRWSEDSAHFAVPLGANVAVVGRDGAIVAVGGRSQWLEAAGDERTLAMLDHWEDSHITVRAAFGLESASQTNQLEVWTVRGTIDGDTIRWDEGVGGEFPLDQGTNTGMVPPNWFRDHDRDENARSLVAGFEVSPSEFGGSIVLRRDDDEPPVGPGGIPEGTEVALLFLHDGQMLRLTIDKDPEVVAASSQIPVWWDVYLVE